MLKVQLHMHSGEDKVDMLSYSAKELIDNASRLGFDVLAFTFHNVFFYPEEIVEYAESKGILLIPGIELTIEKKHVLVYGIKEKPNIKTFEDLRKFDADLVIAPHPYYPRMFALNSKLREHEDCFDVVEHAGLYLSFLNPNKKARKFAEEFNKPFFGMADVHNLKTLDKTYSLVDAEKNEKSVLKAIKDGKFEIVSEPLKLSFFIPHVVKGILKHILFYPLRLTQK